MALIVPSWIGNSYCFPVRLSVIVRLSLLMVRRFCHRKTRMTLIRQSDLCHPWLSVAYLVVVLSRRFDLSLSLFTSSFRFVAAQTKILQSLAQISARSQAVENCIAS